MIGHVLGVRRPVALELILGESASVDVYSLDMEGRALQLLVFVRSAHLCRSRPPSAHEVPDDLLAADLPDRSGRSHGISRASSRGRDLFELEAEDVVMGAEAVEGPGEIALRGDTGRATRRADAEEEATCAVDARPADMVGAARPEPQPVVRQRAGRRAGTSRRRTRRASLGSTSPR